MANINGDAALGDTFSVSNLQSADLLWGTDLTVFLGGGEDTNTPGPAGVWAIVG